MQTGFDRMKVAIVLEHLDPRRGGLEHWTWQFTRAMADRGHEMHVLARSFAPQADHHRIRFHAVTAGRSRMQYAAALQRRLLGLDCDIVHETGAGWHCNVFQPHFGSRQALLERRLRALPAVLQPARRLAVGLLPRYRQFQRLAARQYVNDGRLFVALSERVADDFVRFHGVKRDWIRIVPNGVDCARFSPGRRREFGAAVRGELRLSENAVLLLLVAHNLRLKGVGPALRALKLLRKRSAPVHLAILGGRRMQGYPLLARALGVQESVSFLGARSDVVPYLAAADLLVHPTFYDSCSLVVLEAARRRACRRSSAALRRRRRVDDRRPRRLRDFRPAPRPRPLRTASSGSSIPGSEAGWERRREISPCAHSFQRNCDRIEEVYRGEIAGRADAGASNRSGRLSAAWPDPSVHQYSGKMAWLSPLRQSRANQR